MRYFQDEASAGTIVDDDDDDVTEEVVVEDTSSKKDLVEKLSDNCSQLGELGHVSTGLV